MPTFVMEVKTIKKHNESQHYKKRFGMCVKTLYREDDEDLLHLIEFMELSKILGTDNIIMYGVNNVSDGIHKVIDHYRYITFR